MKIEIDGKYVITGDQNQFILNEKKVVKEGKNAGQEALAVVGYYPKLSWLINSLIVRDIRTSDIDSLEAIQQRITEIGRQCEAACEGASA
ncbi:DUF5405 family protein [Tatumella punctata]|uniref:DUF5405 family protein n=1 Tax=Tatumella punctata TaxID=399969 RepID=A0ABW1VRC1_9GAMM